MELSQKAARAINSAISYARENSREFITPEMILLAILKDEDFSDAFNACGGDVFSLCSNVDFADRDVSLASWIVLPKYYEGNKDIVLRYTRAVWRPAWSQTADGSDRTGLYRSRDSIAAFFR